MGFYSHPVQSHRIIPDEEHSQTPPKFRHRPSNFRRLNLAFPVWRNYRSKRGSHANRPRTLTRRKPLGRGISAFKRITGLFPIMLSEIASCPFPRYLYQEPFKSLRLHFGRIKLEPPIRSSISNSFKFPVISLIWAKLISDIPRVATQTPPQTYQCVLVILSAY